MVTITFTDYDNEGNVLSSDTLDLNDSAIDDIVNQAASVIIARRNDDVEGLELALNELEECLTTYEVVSDLENYY